MNNPKHNFTIIPNWLVGKFSGAEYTLYFKMYNGWCLMKDADGWYYRSLSKLKGDLGITCKNDDKLLGRIKKFEELGILTVERSGKKTNRYKFNEDFMFNHEEDSVNETTTPEGNKATTPKGYKTTTPEGYKKSENLLPQKGRIYNTLLKDKKENTVQYNTVHLQDTVISDNSLKEEINKEEKGVTEQGFLSDNGFSNSSLINEGNKFIHEQDRQGINETVSLTSKESGKNFGLHTLQELMELDNATEDTPTPSSKDAEEDNELNNFNKIKEFQSMCDSSHTPSAKATLGSSDSEEPPQSSAHPPLTENAMTMEIATAIINSLGDYYADGAGIIEHEPNKFMVELAYPIPYMELTNTAPNYCRRYGKENDLCIIREDEGKCCSNFEMYFYQ